MNFILNQKYSEGNTPIRPEEAKRLIPRISTMDELNEYEALNILRAHEWAFDGRTMKSTDPLEEPYVRELHHRMFDNVWKWAGTYRQTERNIGCDPKEIVQRIPRLLANTRYWLVDKTFTTNEALLRFRHQLTRIHPFANGNGRLARMIADVVAVKYGRAEFTWGAGKALVAQGDVGTRYLAALRTLDANENDVKSLLEFARS
jgi:Fic-DOC domain mobile mystery protein B